MKRLEHMHPQGHWHLPMPLWRRHGWNYYFQFPGGKTDLEKVNVLPKATELITQCQSWNPDFSTRFPLGLAASKQWRRQEFEEGRITWLFRHLFADSLKSWFFKCDPCTSTLSITSIFARNASVLGSILDLLNQKLEEGPETRVSKPSR